MSEKTFLIKMDDTKFCDVREYGEVIGIFYCQKIPYCSCKGNLNDRPEWCPLQEHSIGECHIKYKETSPYWEHKF